MSNEHVEPADDDWWNKLTLNILMWSHGLIFYFFSVSFTWVEAASAAKMVVTSVKGKPSDKDLSASLSNGIWIM